MEIRPAIAEDYDAFVRLQPELGTDDPAPSRERFEGDVAARTIVAVEAGAIVGYCLVEALSEVGYVRNVVSDPRHRRRGIGRAMMEALRDRFVRAGATTWCLNVKPDNVAAMTLYERCGLRTAYRSSMLRFARDVVLAAPPPDLVCVPIPPALDESVEPKFGLLVAE